MWWRGGGLSIGLLSFSFSSHCRWCASMIPLSFAQRFNSESCHASPQPLAIQFEKETSSAHATEVAASDASLHGSVVHLLIESIKLCRLVTTTSGDLRNSCIQATVSWA
mmetsp:Transcript_3037/g.8591  ORF Transcript_3037/g.8591 Transcript_3037/m.8591 type:complete len:109 (-) Transcript_3037:1534-1860(-)